MRKIWGEGQGKYVRKINARRIDTDRNIERIISRIERKVKEREEIENS